ncbi:MAG: nucleotidyltransferase domain-containing protein [Bacteroidota bacterium]
MGKTDILHILRENQHLIRSRFFVKRMGLFGSYAKGTQNTKSDIDLILEFEEGHRLGLIAMYELESFIKGILHTDKIDLVNYKFMNPVVKSEMEKSVQYV